MRSKVSGIPENPTSEDMSFALGECLLFRVFLLGSFSRFRAHQLSTRKMSSPSMSQPDQVSCVTLSPPSQWLDERKGRTCQHRALSHASRLTGSGTQQPAGCHGRPALGLGSTGWDFLATRFATLPNTGGSPSLRSLPTSLPRNQLL